jgi:hypothetical protein
VKVSAQFQKITLLVNQYGLVSPLEQMTVSFPLDIDVRSVRAIHVVHDFAQISRGGFDEQMVVIGHEDIAVEDKAILCLPFMQIFLEFPIIGYVEKNLTPFVATSSYMIHGAFIF